MSPVSRYRLLSAVLTGSVSRQSRDELKVVRLEDQILYNVRKASSVAGEVLVNDL